MQNVQFHLRPARLHQSQIMLRLTQYCACSLFLRGSNQSEIFPMPLEHLKGTFHFILFYACNYFQRLTSVPQSKYTHCWRLRLLTLPKCNLGLLDTPFSYVYTLLGYGKLFSLRERPSKACLFNR